MLPCRCSESAMCRPNLDSSQCGPMCRLKIGVGLFDTYRCDRTINLGMSLANMSKALKCANNDDTCMIKYEEGDSDSITFTFADTKRDNHQDVHSSNMNGYRQRASGYSRARLCCCVRNACIGISEDVQRFDHVH
ncbi:proliferating cell nuclear antigen domain protein [Cooperia oncophora]